MKKIFAFAAVAAMTLANTAMAQTDPDESADPIDLESSALVFVPLEFNHVAGDLAYGNINPQDLAGTAGTDPDNHWDLGIGEIYRQLTFSVDGQDGDDYKITITPGAGASEMFGVDGVDNDGNYANATPGNEIYGGRVIRIGLDPTATQPLGANGQSYYAISFTDKQNQPRFTGEGTVGASEGNVAGAALGEHNIAASISGPNVPPNSGIDSAMRGVYAGTVVFTAAYD
jgi:hypothetical protein